MGKIMTQRMNGITSDGVRPLTVEEIDAVAGGMVITYSYGNFTMWIAADEAGYGVCTRTDTNVNGAAPNFQTTCTWHSA